jgi:predicted Rossmann fold nucleotide-binding protein DprA/Smf involved in DNA uptake
VERGERVACAAVLACLYLRGSPYNKGVSRRRFGSVLDRMMSRPVSLVDAAQSLRDVALHDEAWCLETPGALDWAARLVADHRVMTLACTDYPQSWARRLGGRAVPALWRSGHLPQCKYVAVIGSRSPSPLESRVARQAGETLASEGLALVTGGAVGCDQAALEGLATAGARGRSVVMLPCGLRRADTRHPSAYLACAEPNAPFATGLAMERNTLIYALADMAFVIGPRLGEGGSWVGAVECLRRRLTPVVVYAEPGNPAVPALVRMGATHAATWMDVARLVGSVCDLTGCDLGHPRLPGTGDSWASPGPWS